METWEEVWHIITSIISTELLLLLFVWACLFFTLFLLDWSETLLPLRIPCENDVLFDRLLLLLLLYTYLFLFWQEVVSPPAGQRAGPPGLVRGGGSLPRSTVWYSAACSCQVHSRPLGKIVRLWACETACIQPLVVRYLWYRYSSRNLNWFYSSFRPLPCSQSSFYPES